MKREDRALMLSSDAPVADPNPLAGIYSAVTRKRMNKTPKQGWYMEQALSVEEARSSATAADRHGNFSAALRALALIFCADIVLVDPAIGTATFETNPQKGPWRASRL